MAALTEEMLAGLVTQLFGTSMLERHGATLVVRAPVRAQGLLRARGGARRGGPHQGQGRGAARRLEAPQRGAGDVAQLNGPKLVDEVFKTCVEPKLVQRRSCSTTHSRCRRSPSRSAGIRTRWSAGSCSCSITSWRTRSASSTTPMNSAAAFEQQTVLRAAGRQGGAAAGRGLSPCAGIRHAARRRAWGWAWTRLTMILADQTNIRDVILFPMLRPE